jgi:2-aminoadipate transaminase
MTPPPIDFARGVPADESFPCELVAECTAAVLRGPQGTRTMQYGPGAGFLPLREWLAERHGVPPEQVALANGSLQFLDFIGWTLLERGATVLVESPTYDRSITLFRRHGAKVVGVPLGKDGPDVDALATICAETKPRLFYTIPDFQNPSGLTATPAVRERIAALAEQHGFWLLEDAPYRPLRYRGESPAPLRDLAPSRTLHMSSFTKQIAPGVRVGYLIGPADVVAKLAATAEATYISPSYIGEATVWEFCRRGWLEPQLERLRELYGPRLEAACTAVKTHLPGALWGEPEGGFFLSLTIPASVGGDALRSRAPAAGLKLSDGRGFFPNPADGDRFVRLPFCALDADTFAEGVRRLATIVA